MLATCGIAQYSYADSNEEKILLYMCLEKQKHGLEKNCNNIRHNLNDLHIANSSNIGIILSNSCLAMINNNITNSCPNYDILQNVYPGVIVNPNSDVISKIRLITISPTLPEFKIKPNSTETTLHNNSFKVTFGKSVYVDDSCENANVSTHWSLLGSIIWYMGENCNDTNTIHYTPHTMIKNATLYTYNSSNAWNELNYWENIKEQCKVKC